MRKILRWTGGATAVLILSVAVRAARTSDDPQSATAPPPASGVHAESPMSRCAPGGDAEPADPSCGSIYIITVTASSETAYWNRNQCGQAESQAEETVALARKDESPQGKLTLASALTSLAGLYRCLGKPGRAEPLYREALDIRTERLAPNDPDIAVSAMNLGDFFRDQREYSSAEAFLQWAFLMGETPGGKASCVSGSAAYLLGKLHYDRAEYNRALQYDRQAYRIFETQPECGRFNLAVAGVELSLTLLQGGGAREAESISARAVAELKTELGDAHPQVALALLAHAACLRKLREGDRATTEFAEAHRILDDHAHSTAAMKVDSATMPK